VTSGGGPATGFGHTCAVLADGTVRCWGSGIFGQLGNGDLENSSTPVAVLGITSASSLAVGSQHSCARLTGGSVRCWGSALEGEIGDGTLGYSTTPVTPLGLPT
jgi:alpha-tubulin suppressor-like RCC1 family protein